MDRLATGLAALREEGCGLGVRFFITDADLGAGSGEQAHRGRANAARTAGDQGDLVGKGESNGHRRNSFQFLSSICKWRSEKTRKDRNRSSKPVTSDGSGRF